MESVKGGLRDVVIGEVMEVVQHPDADRLRITQVNVGQEALLQIVCGAPNVAIGQKVLIALVGSTLYPGDGNEPLKIKKSKIRGVESLGMICAEDELGIGTYCLCEGFLKKALNSCLLILVSTEAKILMMSSSIRFNAMRIFLKIILLVNSFSAIGKGPSFLPLLRMMKPFINAANSSSFISR